ncbi:MAG: hypothetical protein OEM52_02050 [bacterium]|nr:hypothetical protein [bacterium]
MKRTTFRGVDVILLYPSEAKRIKPNIPLEQKIPGFPHVYGIRHADYKWRMQQHRLGRKYVNEFADLLAMKPITCDLNQFDRTIVLTNEERAELHRVLEGQWHSVK